MTNAQLLENTRQWRKTPKGVLTNIYQHMKSRSKKYNYRLDFSLKEIHNKFLCDNKFLNIYKNWVNNGYKYYDKPSIDRINANLGYQYGNIQILSWQENRRKGDKECSIKKQKPIRVLDMNGNLLGRFDSIKEAVAKLKLNQGLVSDVLRGRRKHTGGYKFVYENPELINQSN